MKNLIILGQILVKMFLVLTGRNVFHQALPCSEACLMSFRSCTPFLTAWKSSKPIFSTKTIRISKLPVRQICATVGKFSLSVLRKGGATFTVSVNYNIYVCFSLSLLLSLSLNDSWHYTCIWVLLHKTKSQNVLTCLNVHTLSIKCRRNKNNHWNQEMRLWEKWVRKNFWSNCAIIHKCSGLPGAES